MEIKKVILTPEMAVKMLENHPNNRNLSTGRLTRYTNDIINNRWVDDTGELIKIDVDGNLIDGQHRLHAVIKANKPIYVHIATGINKDVFSVIDSGKSRSASDVLKIAGVLNTNKVAAFIQLYNQYKNTNYRYDSVNIDTGMTSKMILKFYNENSKRIDTIISKSTVFYHQFQKVLNYGDVALFYALFTDISPYKGLEFIRELCQGTDITNDVIILLRNRLLSDKISSSNKMLVKHRRALIIKAWNIYYLDKKLKVLKFNPEVEEFPVIIGLEN